MKKESVYFKGIASKHGFTFLNYAENYPLCNDTCNFVAAVHMNKWGTHKFSVDFAKKLCVILNHNVDK